MEDGRAPTPRNAAVPAVSFVVAAHDECASLPLLLDEIEQAGRAAGPPFEAVVVDDGSDDGTAAWLEGAVADRPWLRVVRHPVRRGQSAALATGIDAARGRWLVTLDADLQNDPADAAALLAALEGADLACGVRVDRRDPWSRRVGSAVANRVRRLVLGDRFRDTGCTLKAWRREVAASLPRPRNWHRYIPVLAERMGFRVVELPVHHRPRRFGATHYGNLPRAWIGLFDLVGIARRLPRRRGAPAREVRP